MADKCRDPIKVMDRFGDGERVAFSQADLESAVERCLHTADLLPCDRSLLISNAIRVDADGAPFLHPPTDHSEELDYQKAGREYEVKKALPDEVEDQRDEKK